MLLFHVSFALAADVIVDDADPGFQLIGSASETGEGGYGAHFWYLPASSAPSASARWTPPVDETALYTVQGYVPLSPFATAVTAPVTFHAHGEIVSGSYDQSIIGGDFHEVFGGRAFKLVVGSAGYVEMTDASGETADLFVGFDAFRFTRVGDAGTAGIGAACATTPDCADVLLCDAGLCREPCTTTGCAPNGVCDVATGTCDVWPVEGTDSGTFDPGPQDTGPDVGADGWPDESVVVPQVEDSGCATVPASGGGWLLLAAALMRRRVRGPGCR